MNMKKNIFYLSLIVAVCACHQTKKTGDKMSDTYELRGSDKILSYPLDSTTKYQFTALFAYTDTTEKEYLTFKNSRNEILFYDLSSGAYLFKTKIENEGPDGVPGASGYYIEDFNNIYLTSVAFPGIIKIDTAGHIVQKIRYSQTNTGYMVNPSYRSYSYFYTPLFIIDSQLYITQKLTQFNPVSKIPVSVLIDTLRNSCYALPFHYPSIVADEDARNVSAFTLAMSRDFNGKDFVYSFYFDENIYLASVDHQTIKIIPATSKYIRKLKIEKRSKDSNLSMKRDLEIPMYGNLVYDKYRNVYYRFAYPEDELDIGLDYKSLTSLGRKKFSIIILDAEFNKIGETLFPDFVYCPVVFFVHQDGLYICNTHPRNPAFDEDVLSFQCFELK